MPPPMLPNWYMLTLLCILTFFLMIFMTLWSAYSFCCRYRLELWLRELATLMEALVESISPGEENYCFDMAAFSLILAIINFSFCIIRI